VAELTKHAQIRSLQRSIPEAAIDLLLDYGDSQRTGYGAESFFFNKSAKRRLHQELGRDGFRRFERYLGAYAIVGGRNEVITVAWRRRRLRRR
jgi:hypothetical protein